ncbi:MAG TPA: hypothetical protein VFE01_08990, partial [Terracidiphilus sp.]|nr:hypothetical protein [Terracidiphilus sp.]
MNRRAAASPLSRSTFRIALFAVLAAFGLGSVGLYAESAKPYYKHGEAAEARQDYDAAYENYEKAYELNPSDLA